MQPSTVGKKTKKALKIEVKICALKVWRSKIIRF